jgi:hypothetical protein
MKIAQGITACKQYCLAAGATQGNIAYTQTVIGKFITRAGKENYKLNYQCKNKKYEKNIYHYSSIHCI